VKRKEGDKVEIVTAKLVPMPDAIPEKLPMPSSAGKALEAQPKGKGLDPTPKLPVPKRNPKDPAPKPKEKSSSSLSQSGSGRLASQLGEGQHFGNPADPAFGHSLPAGARIESVLFQDDPFGTKKPGKKDKVQTGYIERTDEALGRSYWLYVPDNYDANVSHGLIVWFHPVGKRGKDGEIMARTFREFCEDHHFIMMGPKSANAEGWVPSETELIVTDVRKVLGQYTTDKTRVVAHGMGKGGQMAFYVGFHARDVFRGVATIGAALGTQPRDNVANQPLSFFITVGDKDPLLKDVESSKQALEEKRFPVVYRLMKESGKEYFDEKLFGEFLNWLDSLDRI
jgi:serine protease Do